VVDDQDDKIADGNESDDAGIFERVESSEEREGNDNEPMRVLGDGVAGQKDGNGLT
jgi:hypothetical protein